MDAENEVHARARLGSDGASFALTIAFGAFSWALARQLERFPHRQGV